MTKLPRLILEHLDIVHPYALPEAGLYSELRQMVRPVATEPEWTDAIYHLLQKELIGFQRDRISDEKKFFIKEAGQVALRAA
jgi:hypothetical protein